MYCRTAIVVLIALFSVALCFAPTPSVAPKMDPHTTSSGFVTSVNVNPGPFYVDFSIANTSKLPSTSNYELQLWDLSETTLSKGKYTFNNSISLGLFQAQTQVKTVADTVTYTTTFPGVANRFTSLILTTTVTGAANATSFETSVALVGYKFVQANANLTFRYYLWAPKSCKINTECNCSATFGTGVNNSGVVVQDAYFYVSPTYTFGINKPPVAFDYVNGALMVSYLNFTGGNLAHDPTTGLTQGQDTPASITKLNLQSTWWFGWSNTTWYIILAVVGVIVLLALVALIGAIIVWNRGKPGYEQV